ncbi:hypothetical protein J5069_02725 [Candidatus Symbiopectobacterium sp. NZEC127]|uniref:hypothetical protein n=1 Tax=Candidatus Symbiopectobacterium sp. NZEC127 TaxID=2820472 RepID=UPI002227B3F1|nr:hypothetical protein [Candidatus Symbiopectobacterium sp. NZEC127]MCW2484804.1 hypothetical protein [Candidatus Symbiopectobacterium sp. NZEC127]
MTTATTVADVLESSLRLVRAQIALEILKTSGITQHAVSTLLFDIIPGMPETLVKRVKGFLLVTARRVPTNCMGSAKDWEQQQKRSEAA